MVKRKGCGKMCKVKNKDKAENTSNAEVNEECVGKGKRQR